MQTMVIEYEGSTVLTTSIARAIQRERDMLGLAIRLSQEALTMFETRYGMSSQEFFEKMEHGALGDSDDFIEWAGEYEILQRTRRELVEFQTMKVCG